MGDYVILMCYYMKLPHVPKLEIKAFVREFEKITDDYKRSVKVSIAAVVVHSDLAARMNLLKKLSLELAFSGGLRYIIKY